MSAETFVALHLHVNNRRWQDVPFFIRDEVVELELSRQPGKDLEPHDELLGDALAGDSFRFARQDYVEEAWRIVDPAIQARPPVHVYEPGSWGPAEADGMVPGGWFVARDG